MEDDPIWLHAREIAEFDDFQNHMIHFRTARGDPDNLPIALLSDQQQAKPRFALTDPRMPTLALAWYLRQHSWDPVSVFCNHTEAPTDKKRCEFDNRGGTKSKWYLMALTKLQEVLPLSQGNVPSGQPVGYYKLLREGHKTMPGLSGKEYTLVYNRRLKGEGRHKKFLPIEDIAVDDDDVFFRSAYWCARATAV